MKTTISITKELRDFIEEIRDKFYEKKNIGEVVEYIVSESSQGKWIINHKIEVAKALEQYKNNQNGNNI